MKKLSSYLLLLSAIVFASCKKEDKCTFKDYPVIAPAAEKTQLEDYLAAASITATAHSSGAYYTITAAGTGANPTICSGVSVRYVGTIIPSGAQFDASAGTDPVSLPLGMLITGWQKLLPLIKEGGVINMYIPPALGYGYQDQTDNNNNVVIPANSYLKFHVELVSVQ